MAAWYPANWQGQYQHPGVDVDLVGGPLDGRSGFVDDALEALWVARLQGHLVVASGRPSPALMPCAVLMGRYVLDVPTRALLWHSCEQDAPSRVRRPRFAPNWLSGVMGG